MPNIIIHLNCILIKNLIQQYLQICTKAKIYPSMLLFYGILRGRDFQYKFMIFRMHLRNCVSCVLSFIFNNFLKILLIFCFENKILSLLKELFLAALIRQLHQFLIPLNAHNDVKHKLKNITHTHMTTIAVDTQPPGHLII